MRGYAGLWRELPNRNSHIKYYDARHRKEREADSPEKKGARQ